MPQTNLTGGDRPGLFSSIQKICLVIFLIGLIYYVQVRMEEWINGLKKIYKSFNKFDIIQLRQNGNHLRSFFRQDDEGPSRPIHKGFSFLLIQMFIYCLH
jgi:hypothetical protein